MKMVGGSELIEDVKLKADELFNFSTQVLDEFESYMSGDAPNCPDSEEIFYAVLFLLQMACLALNRADPPKKYLHICVRLTNFEKGIDYKRSAAAIREARAWCEIPVSKYLEAWHAKKKRLASTELLDDNDIPF